MENNNKLQMIIQAGAVGLCILAMALAGFIFTKYDKLGGTFVLSENPFKKPLIMYKAGSTFDSSDSNLFVGSLIHNIHKNESICHHAFAPVVMFKEDGSNE